MPETAEAIRGRIARTVDVAQGAGRADLVIEAVFEELPIKQDPASDRLDSTLRIVLYSAFWRL